jgi:hypothetical protein
MPKEQVDNQKQVMMTYTPTVNPKAEMLEDIIHALKILTKVESELDKLDIGDIDYQTVITVAERARASARDLNDVFQKRIYQRPFGLRNIRQSYTQSSKRRR